MNDKLKLKKLRSENRRLKKELRSSKELYDFVMKKRISERKELSFLREIQGLSTTKDEA
jgi:cell shape-determining protein MreC